MSRLRTADRAAAVTRAGNRCEYCRLPARHSPLPFHLDHVVPASHDGGHGIDNRALACPHCNLRKGTNVSTFDAARRVVVLFDPRRQRWPRHFTLDETSGVIAGRTKVGRATIKILAMNDPPHLEQRRVLLVAGLWHAGADD